MSFAAAQPTLPIVTPEVKSVLDRDAPPFRRGNWEYGPRGFRDEGRYGRGHDRGRGGGGCRNPVCRPGELCPLYRCA